MAKEMIKKAGSSAVEAALQSIMPQLIERLDRIQHDITLLDSKVDQLREDMHDKFDQTRDVINELGQRVAKVEGKLDVFVSAVNRQSDKMDKWIERLVQVEMTSTVRRRGKRAS